MYFYNFSLSNRLQNTSILKRKFFSRNDTFFDTNLNIKKNFQLIIYNFFAIFDGLLDYSHNSLTRNSLSRKSR